jgi:predicted phage tail protein
MAITKQYVYHQNSLVPRIVGSKGGGKGGDSSPPVEAPNSLFSTDILFVTVGLGEGPIYRINPNGPQDIQIQDSTIDDLLNIDGNGLNNTERFVYSYTTGTTNQGPLRVFGETVATPQNFGSAVKLKNGNLSGIPSSSVTLQDTSISDWDA